MHVVCLSPYEVHIVGRYPMTGVLSLVSTTNVDLLAEAHAHVLYLLGCGIVVHRGDIFHFEHQGEDVMRHFHNLSRRVAVSFS